MGSSRLPGKVLMKIFDQPMIHHVIKQILSSKSIDKVIIATTSKKEDKEVVNFCKKNNINYFCGSSIDLLDRYYNCAKKFECDPIIRITADCPFIDPKVIDSVVEKFVKNSFDYVANNIEKVGDNWQNSMCKFPQGMTVEISTFVALEKAWREAKKPSEREHVFPYIQFNPKLFNISNVINDIDLSYIRCTVDRNEDLIFMRKLYEQFPKNNKTITINEIKKAIKNNPDLVAINNKIPFDEGYQLSIIDDKKRGF